MATTLLPISPLEYITDRDPVPEEVLNVARWYKTETIELTFGEYVGRPNEFIDLQKSDLIYYLGNGWHVSEVLARDSDGQWVTSASATARQEGEAESSNEANSKSEALSIVVAPGRSVTSETGTYTNGTDSDNNYLWAKGEASSSAKSENEAKSTTTTKQQGGPYWAAWSKVRLVRRRMQSEAVLQDMIASFTKAYNEGRQINDERYDELVALYAIMLSRTENEANALSVFSPEDFKPLAKMVTDAVKDALSKYATEAENIPKDWLKSREDEINRKFDKLLEEARSRLITQGLYNGTVWPTTKSGIERDRQIALNDLKDSMVTLKVDVYGKIAGATADIGQKLLECEIRVIEAQQKMLLGPTEVRNTVFKWMLDFMERRNDDYPGLDQLVTIADKLGYADGGMAGPTS